MSLLNLCQIPFVKFEFFRNQLPVHLFQFASIHHDNSQFYHVFNTSTFLGKPYFPPPKNKSQMKHPLREVIMLSQPDLITNLPFSVHRPSWYFSSRLAYYCTNCAKRTAVPINSLGSFYSAHRRHNPFKLQGVPIAV